LRSSTAILIVKEVIKPEMNQFAPGSVLTTFAELMEIHDSVSGKSQCRKEDYEHTVDI